MYGTMKGFGCMGCGQPGQMLAGEIYQRTPEEQSAQDTATKMTDVLTMPRTVAVNIGTTLVALMVPVALAVGVIALLGKKKGRRK